MAAPPTGGHAAFGAGRPFGDVAWSSQVRAQVERWSREAGVAWTRDELEDVTYFLNDRYYRFNCQAGRCGPGQAGAGMTRVAGATQH